MINFWWIVPSKITSSPIIHFKITISISHVAYLIMTIHYVSHQVIITENLEAFLHLIIKQFERCLLIKKCWNGHIIQIKIELCIQLSVAYIRIYQINSAESFTNLVYFFLLGYFNFTFNFLCQ